MSSLICSEVINESRKEGRPLYLVTIDTQKAFDVVNHVIKKNPSYLKKVHHSTYGILWMHCAVVCHQRSNGREMLVIALRFAGVSDRGDPLPSSLQDVC